MRTYSRPLDLLLQAALLHRDGKHIAAAKQLTAAVQHADFDDSVEDLTTEQQQMFDAQGEPDDQFAKALARVARTRKPVKASAPRRQLASDDQDDDLDLAFDDMEEDQEQAGTGDLDTEDNDEDFVIETSDMDQDDDQDDDQDKDKQGDQQQSRVQARLDRAARNRRAR